MENPIISLDKLSEPLTKLVEVISNGIGTLYAPFGTVRQAKADAKAKIIHANADAQSIEIYDRANSRLSFRESLRQENIERIASQAALELPKEVSAEPVDKDWTLQYFDHAQDVCDKDMQTLWARILAGEVATPGTYSKRALQFLKTLDKDEAEAFTTICSLAVTISDKWPNVPVEVEALEAIRERHGAGDYIGHFASIGLLSTDMGNISRAYVRDKEPILSYFGRTFRLEAPPEQKLEIPFGLQLRAFTSIGYQLAMIAGATPIDGYIDSLGSGCFSRYELKFVE